MGREDLRKTINSIETLASISEDKPEFEKLEAKLSSAKRITLYWIRYKKVSFSGHR